MSAPAPTDRPLLLLAPMEGVMDAILRDVLTQGGGVDRCVSEFIRVTHRLLPEAVLLRRVPELAHGGCTPAGVPVRPQLLGSDPACVADNAARLAGLGAPGVDLNFGCPAKTVNRHRGGAALLDEPELLAAIVGAVRSAVPAHCPVSAKMRLGLRDDARALDCALALQSGGADEIVVHARTQAQGYRPPAYWDRIAPLRAALSVRLVANGEIWSVADAQACRAQSGCADLMLGRGLVASPALGRQIRAVDAHPLDNDCYINNSCYGSIHMPWRHIFCLIQGFWRRVRAELLPAQQAGRLKQWLALLQRQYPQAQTLFTRVRTLHDPLAVEAVLAHCAPDSLAEP
ncbi:MAG: tRNA dihydrouridine(16) synthase DusC [Rhodoferax sp.]